MRRANQGIRIAFNQRDAQSLSGSKRGEIQQKKKPILLRQLENELKNLDQIYQEDFKETKDPYLNDNILNRLQIIAKEASKYQLKEIQKLCKLAIGKRILNIELKKKKEEYNSKMQRKEKIELFFRENRIKRYNYEPLIQEKLKDNTLVAKAYENGKGFIESTAMYQDKYAKALVHCDYLNTIKGVNRIFYKNYSSIHKRRPTFTDILWKIIWIPIIILMSLAITLPFSSFPYEEVLIMALLCVILVIIILVSTSTFCDKPNNNNQIQQSIEDVRDYFEQINHKNKEKGANIVWICADDFMYLEVVFNDGFPT